MHAISFFPTLFFCVYLCLTQGKNFIIFLKEKIEIKKMAWIHESMGLYIGILCKWTKHSVS